MLPEEDSLNTSVGPVRPAPPTAAPLVLPPAEGAEGAVAAPPPSVGI